MLLKSLNYWYNDNTYVIRAWDIEKVKEHFEAIFGVEFILEKHGEGPEHYACAVADKVVEIYPMGRP